MERQTGELVQLMPVATLLRCLKKMRVVFFELILRRFVPHHCRSLLLQDWKMEQLLVIRKLEDQKTMSSVYDMVAN